MNPLKLKISHFLENHVFFCSSPGTILNNFFFSRFCQGAFNKIKSIFTSFASDNSSRSCSSLPQTQKRGLSLWIFHLHTGIDLNKPCGCQRKNEKHIYTDFCFTWKLVPSSESFLPNQQKLGPLREKTHVPRRDRHSSWSRRLFFSGGFNPSICKNASCSQIYCNWLLAQPPTNYPHLLIIFSKKRWPTEIPHLSSSPYRKKKPVKDLAKWKNISPLALPQPTVIFHLPRFPWNSRGPISLTKTLPFGGSGRVWGGENNLTRRIESPKT